MQNVCVGFCIHEVDGLSDDYGQALDLMVTVTCCGLEYFTSVKRGRTHTSCWNEYHTFPILKLHHIQFRSEKIKFELEACKTLTRNSKIGRSFIQLSLIQRERRNLRLPLREEDTLQQKGYLRVSIAVFETGCFPPPFYASPSQYATKKRCEIVGASAGRKGSSPSYILVVTIHKLEDTPKHVEQHLTCSFGGCVAKNQILEKSNEASSDMTFVLPVATPLLEDSIVISIWVKKAWFPSELYGQGCLSFASLLKRAIPLQWFNFHYLAVQPVEPHKHMMQPWFTGLRKNTYSGRIMLSARVITNVLTQELAPKCISSPPSVAPKQRVVTINVQLFVIEGAFGSECSLQISCGPNHTRSAWVKGEKMQSSISRYTFDSCLDKQAKPLRLQAALPEQPSDQLPVHFSICSKSFFADPAYVAQSQFPLNELRESRGRIAIPEFYTFEALSYPRKPAGSALLLCDTRQWPHQSSLCLKPEEAQYALRFYLYGANNLPYHSQSKSSLQVEVLCAGSCAVSSKKPASFNPVWMECMEVHLQLYTFEGSNVAVPPISVTLYDKGMISSSIVGETLLRIERGADAPYKCYETPMRASSRHSLCPQWISLTKNESFDNTCMEKEFFEQSGTILAAVEILSKLEADTTKSADMWPALCPCDITFSLLGLRDILLPVAFPVDSTTELKYIIKFKVTPYDKTMLERRGLVCEFDCSTSLDKNEGTSLYIRCWDSNRGCCSDMFRTARTCALLPILHVYDPILTIEVLATSTSGWKEVLLGESHMRLLPYIKWTRQCDSETFGDGTVTAWGKKPEQPFICYHDANEADFTQRHKPLNELIGLRGAAEVAQALSVSVESSSAATNAILSSGVPKGQFSSYVDGDATNMQESPGGRNFFIPHQYAIKEDNALDKLISMFHKCCEMRSRNFTNFESSLGDICWDIQPLHIPDAHTRGANRGTIKATLTVEKQKGFIENLVYIDKKLIDRFRSEEMLPPFIHLTIYLESVSYIQSSHNLAVQCVAGRKVICCKRVPTCSFLKVELQTFEELDIKFPEESRLEIRLIRLSNNEEVVGSTAIDLENRWFSMRWRELARTDQLPIEQLTFINPASHLPEGGIELKVDMTDLNGVRHKSTKRRQREDLAIATEIRLAVRECRKIPLSSPANPVNAMIEFELQSETDKAVNPLIQSTDTHYNCTDGIAVFNWRVVYPQILLPANTCKIQVRLFEDAFIAERQCMGEAQLNLNDYATSTQSLPRNTSVDLKLKKLPIYEDNNKGQDCFVTLQLDILKQVDADAKMVGLGRDPPNYDPFLVTPSQGRDWALFLMETYPLGIWKRIFSMRKWILGSASVIGALTFGFLLLKLI